MDQVKTFTATIYVGRKVRETGEIKPAAYAREACQKYCDQVGLCVTLTETQFIYTDGCEPGVVVGLINYPRFPTQPATIREHAIELAKRLMTILDQQRVSVVMPEETVMLSANP